MPVLCSSGLTTSSADMGRYVRGRMYERDKKGVGEHKGNQYVERGHNDTIPTADKLAEQFNVSPLTIKRDAKFFLEVENDPELKQAVVKEHKKASKYELN